MKKALIAVGVVLISFIIGFLAIYFTVPMISPERYVQAQLMVDSLRQQQSVELLGDSAIVTAQIKGSLSSNDSLGGPVVGANSVLKEELASHEETISKLRDSLRLATQRLDEAEVQQAKMRKIVDAMNKRLESIEAQRVEIKDLSSTIPKLEDKDLSALLSRLDLNVLGMLYTEATGKNRSRILQSLTSERAALLVNYIIKGPDVARSLSSASTSPTLSSTND